MVEHIYYKEEEFALILRNEFQKDGITFFTPDHYSQQLAYMKHKAGKFIEPHLHTEIKREVYYTNEVLIIKSGKLRVDFYTEAKEHFDSRILGPGDIILLIKGGHGFEVLEDLEMVEVKQGPYNGEMDKIRFKADRKNEISIGAKNE